MKTTKLVLLCRIFLIREGPFLGFVDFRPLQALHFSFWRLALFDMSLACD